MTNKANLLVCLSARHLSAKKVYSSLVCLSADILLAYLLILRRGKPGDFLEHGDEVAARLEPQLAGYGFNGQVAISGRVAEALARLPACLTRASPSTELKFLP